MTVAATKRSSGKRGLSARETPKRVIPFARPWIGDEERQAVLRVLDGSVLAHGPESKAFEADFAAFLGSKAHAVAVSSCMAALHLSYLHFGIGAGDEVIVPAQTHTATAHAVEWVGAKPVFVDCDPTTGNLTAEAIEAAVTPRTKAIGLVHFLGIPCQMTQILKVAKKHGLKVIEDCALAVGTRREGTHAGLSGDAGCFSFYPVKHMTTGEGGMFVTRHEEVAKKVSRLRAFGVDRSHVERAKAGLYDVPTLGLNYRMSELQAAMGRVQLSRMPEALRIRAKNFAALKDGLKSLSYVRVLDAQDAASASSHYCLSIILEGPLADRRDALAARLKEAGIGTSIYYPHPVPRLGFYRKKYGYQAGRFRNAEEISDRSIALPVGPHLASEDVGFIIEAIRSITEEWQAS